MPAELTPLANFSTGVAPIFPRNVPNPTRILWWGKLDEQLAEYFGVGVFNIALT